MYIPNFSKALSSRSIVNLTKSHFTLDASGVAGFFGGAEAASAMATAHLYRNRKWWGWYNSPGSYEVAKRYGLLTRYGFVFGGGHSDPTELLTLFELDGQKGPQFLRVHSRNVSPDTNHLASVFMKRFSLQRQAVEPTNGRQAVGVTIVELDSPPARDTIKRIPIPTPCNPGIIAALPIIASTATCILCVTLAQDWYSFSLILWGMIANGVTCYVIGSIELKFWCPTLAGESDHRVNGILITDTNIILLKGREDAAMAVAWGKFMFPSPPSGRRFHKYMGLCSVLLLIQFIVQLLVIPQATLFGQIMFVASLGVSWCYNLWLCSFEKGAIQQEILFKAILNVKEGDVRTYQLENWPATVVFVLLTLVSEDKELDEEELKTALDVLVEDTDKVWKTLKLAVFQLLQPFVRSTIVSENDLDALIKELKVKGGETNELSRRDRHKLNNLLTEVQSGIEVFKSRVTHVTQTTSLDMVKT